MGKHHFAISTAPPTDLGAVSTLQASLDFQCVTAHRGHKLKLYPRERKQSCSQITERRD